MSIKSLEGLFVDALKDIYDAEKRLTKALPKVVKNAASPELKEAVEAHLGETKNQVARLEKIFEILERRATGKPCEAMKGLLAEAEEIMGQDYDEDSVMDIGIIGGCRKVEHYEIATYSTLIALATTLGHEEVVALLTETLEEEEAADQQLTEIAQSITVENPFGEAA